MAIAAILFSTVQIQDKLPHVGLCIARQTALVGNGSGEQRRRDTKPSGDVTTNVVQRPSITEPIIFDPNGGELHAWINGGPHRSTQRIPHFVIEPLKEALPTIPVEILKDGINSQYISCVKVNSIQCMHSK